MLNIEAMVTVLGAETTWIVRLFPDRLACVKAAEEIDVDATKMRKYHCQEVSSPQK